MTEFIGLIISAVGAIVVPIVVKRMELSAARNVAETSPAPVTGASTGAAPDTINYGLVLRHVAILQFVANVVGVLLGGAIGLAGATLESMLPLFLIIGVLVLSAGFFWSALAVDREVRTRFLALVAAGVALVTLFLNSLILQLPLSFEAIILAFAQTYLSMVIGLFLANRVK